MGAVGELIDLFGSRNERDARLAAAALHARMHPALRWQVGSDTALAHRRTPLGRSVCGVVGRLRLAATGTPLCATCYPQLVFTRRGQTA